MMRSIGWAAIGSSLIAASIGMAEDPVKIIQLAILEQGANWEAGETSISRLPLDLRRQLCGRLPEPPYPKRYRTRTTRATALDSAWDWRDHDGANWMTLIRNQGACGSCWAFGALGALEALINIQTETPDQTRNLSEQYLLSCSDGSCNGWYMSSTCDFLKEHETVDEECFPYYASDNIPCEDRCPDWRFRRRKLTDWSWVNEEIDSIKTAIMDGPVYVGFDVYTDFFYYQEGIYEHVWGEYEGGHAVVMLGWDDGDSCWICKNSWGTGWGEVGWFRIKYGECGIDEEVIWMEPADNRWPLLEYVAADYIELEGDGDGNPNPGETISGTISLYNEPSFATAEELIGILSSSDSGVAIHDSLGTYPPIGGDESQTNDDDPFVLYIAQGAKVGAVPISLELRANEHKEYPCTTRLEVGFEITLNQAGWPVLLDRTVRGSPALIDISRDPRPELIIGGLDGLLYVKGADGSDMPGFPYPLDGMAIGSPAVGDLDADGDLELVIGTWNGSIHFINPDGSRFIPPVEAPDRFMATPALSDVDLDGDLEVVIGSYEGNLYLLEHDGSSYCEKFPLSLGAKIKSGAAVADLNQDGSKEVIVAASDGRVWAISRAGTTLAGWPVRLNEGLEAAPSVADLDHTGPKIVVNSSEGSLYILNPDGTQYRRIPTGGRPGNSPTFLDLDGDSDLEIFFSASNKLYGYHHNGDPVAGWPKETSSTIRTAACFADLDKDGSPEVIVGAGEEVWAFHINGQPVDKFPISTRSPILSSPAIADLDEDSDLEIAFGNDLGIQVIDVKTASGSNRYWNMYRGNPQRTGNYEDLPYGVREPRALKPTIPYALSQNQPNPFTNTTVISYGLPAAGWVKLEIYNVIGQQVATLIDGYEEPGLKTVEWDGSDMAAGVYFYLFKSGRFIQLKKMILLK